MPGAAVTRQVRENTMRMVDAGQASLKDLAAQRWFSLRTAQRLRRSWLDNGHSLPPENGIQRRGRPRKLSLWALRHLKALCERDTSMRLGELQRQLELDGHGYFTLACLSRALKRLGLSRKKLNKHASQRSYAKRYAYLRDIGHYLPEQLVFVDESAVDLRNTQRTYGRAPVGYKAYKSYLLSRGSRLSVLPAISLGRGPFAISMKQGTNSGDDFYLYLRDVLLPQMRSFPAERSVLVCDNASIHKISSIRKLVEMHGECATVE